jgi:cyclophilin family peptidyl-prolyl cis-trans isomerase
MPAAHHHHWVTARRAKFVAILAVLMMIGLWWLLHAAGHNDSDHTHHSNLGGKALREGGVGGSQLADAILRSTSAPQTPAPTFLQAHLFTEYGTIVWELIPSAAPQTVANFVKLATTGWYNGTTLYRYEANFCLQGGGWPKKGSPYPAVPLEYKLPNKKFAVSMARTADPHSATSEYSIMLNDNSQWLGPGGSDPHGYAVFAQVIDGFSVIEKLGTLKTRKDGLTVFVSPVRIDRIEIITTTTSSL